MLNNGLGINVPKSAKPHPLTRLRSPDLQCVARFGERGETGKQNSPLPRDNLLSKKQGKLNWSCYVHLILLDALGLKSSDSCQALGLYSELQPLLRLSFYPLAQQAKTPHPHFKLQYLYSIKTVKSLVILDRASYRNLQRNGAIFPIS